MTQKEKQLTCRVVVRFIWNNAYEGILSIIQTIIKKKGRWIHIESCDSPRKCIQVGMQKWKAGRQGPNQGSLQIHFVWLALNLIFFPSTFKTRRFHVQNQISSISLKHVKRTCSHWVCHLLSSAPWGWAASPAKRGVWYWVSPHPSQQASPTQVSVWPGSERMTEGGRGRCFWGVSRGSGISHQLLWGSSLNRTEILLSDPQPKTKWSHL